jgi:flagellar hook-associated protein 2
MAISSIGVGSGLPLDQLLIDLRNSENQTLALIQSRQVSVESRLSAYGTIKNSLAALKTASDALGKADTFGALKASVSGESFTATASNKAIAGQYRVSVQQLATSQSLISKGQADRAAVLSAESDTVNIDITMGDDSVKTITLNRNDLSLNAVLKAINDDSGMGVNATFIKGGDDPANPHHFMLTAKKTGSEGAVKEVRVTGSDALQDIIGFTQNPAEGDPANPMSEQAAKNALLTINDIAVVSQTNTVENAIEGITLSLAKIEAEPTTLTVSRNDSVTSNAVNAFVTAYNTLQNTLKSLTAYNVETQKSSALTGDSLARKVQSQIRDALNVVGESGSLRSLSQLGITTQITDGTLKVDADKLSAALKDNMADVQRLFTGENGLSARLATVADAFVRSDGLIASATDGINSTIKDLQKQYDAASARIDDKMENYRKQFTALDSMVAQMNSVSSYLTQQLSMLGNIGKEK